MLSTDRDRLVNYESPTHGVKDRTNSYKRRDGQEMSQGKYCRLLTDLILLSIPVLVKFSCFFFKFSFLVFWQSSKKKSTIGKLPQYLGWRKSLAFFQRCTITLTSMHNNQDTNCVAYPPIFILIICMMLANPKNTTVFVEQLCLTNTWMN